MAFAPAPEPKSLLGYHRLLSPSAGIRVSPICLGAMNFGNAWEPMMGKCDKSTAFEMLDYFHSMGGNFIDTANNYQNEESETWLGEWMAKKGVRDEMVIATKFTTGYKAYDSSIVNKSNFGGNHSKSIRLSVEASLKKLQTSYIDVLYMHWWDFTTNIPELMQTLNDMVTAGKVYYLGVSDTPAWIVSKANEYARNHGMRQFVVYQGRWSAAQRDFERDIIPMCQAEGMGLAPWGALGGGKFKSDEDRKSTEGRNRGEASEAQIAVTKVLEKIAKAKGTAITSVALAYVIHKTPYVFPICGGRKIEHLMGNIEALSLVLTDDDMEEIEDATPFDLGFPLNFLTRPKGGVTGPKDVWLTDINSHLDFVEPPKAIASRKTKESRDETREKGHSKV